jgi:hypothetical protein
MKFEIKPFREKKINALAICIIFTVFPLIFLGLFALIKQRHDVITLIIICLVTSLILSVFIFSEIQWYCIEEDKIIVKNYLGIVNEVYFEQVLKIVDIELPIVKYQYARCFIFVDKNIKIEDKLFWGTVHNSKFNFVRVPVTDELIEHLKQLKLMEMIYIPKKIF